MRVLLVHVRDPQGYAVTSENRGRNGRIQVMGFPPISIVSPPSGRAGARG